MIILTHERCAIIQLFHNYYDTFLYHPRMKSSTTKSQNIMRPRLKNVCPIENRECELFAKSNDILRGLMIIK